ncbi:MAG: metalloregulator ArsR/SmtB family transcription factor [Atribacterota bacterium]
MKIEDLTKLFKALSDKTRLRIVRLLVQSGRAICVCEIMDALLENQYNVSKHLNILKSVNLVQENKMGRWVYYSIIKSENPCQEFCIKFISRLPEEIFALDTLRLEKRLSLRKNGKCVIGVNSAEWQKIITQLFPKGGNQDASKTHEEGVD